MTKIPLLFCCFFFASFSLISQNLDSLYAATKEMKNDSVKIRALNRIASSYLFNDAKKALDMIEEGEHLAKQNQFMFGLIELTNTHGIYMDITGKADSARYYFEKSLKLSRDHQFKNIEVMCLNNLGMFHWNQSHYKQALNYFFQALKMYENQGSERGTAAPLNNIGLIYQDMNLPEKSLEYHQKALEIREKYNLEKDQVASLNNIGINLKTLGRFHEAVMVLEKGLKLADKSNNKIGFYQILDNLANTYQELGDYSKAIDLYFKALNKPENYEFDERENISILVNLVSLFNYKNQPKEALKYSKQAFDLIDKYPAESIANGELYLNTAESYFMLQDLDQARQLTKEYVVLKDSLFSKENAKEFANLEVKYDTEKKEKQILVHRAELAEQKLTIQNKNYQIYGAIAAAILLGVIGFFMYNQQKLKNIQLAKESELKSALLKIETQNKLQEQRLRISRDLHDNIGAQLTFIISSLDNLKYAYNIQDGRLKDKLDEIGHFASDTIFELRDTIWAMNKEYITIEDLQSRIINYLEKAKKATQGVQFHLGLAPTVDKTDVFDSIKGIAVYRMVQESIHNALKHANASEIVIEIDKPKNYLVTIKDNGQGFSIDDVNMGNGLHNLEKRSGDIGAYCQIDSKPGVGTQITLSLPPHNSLSNAS